MKNNSEIHFVITGIQPWDITIGSNCKNIALELSKNYKVLYVNKPLDRISSFKNGKSTAVQVRKKVIQGELSPYQEINNNLTVFTPPIIVESINWMPGFLFKKFNNYSSKIFACSIKEAIHELNFENIVLFSDSDMFNSFNLKEILRPKCFVYYSRDNLMTVNYWKKHGQYFEPEIMKKADAIVTNSLHLQKIAERNNPASFYIGQGCEIESFLNAQNEEKPKELNALTKEIIGYVGLLTSRRLCIKTIWEIAKRMPDKEIVLVGPEEECFEQSNLHSLPNVHFIGKVAAIRLPSFINAFSICINPQIVNELTKGNYPRKIDEYLAAGKPVVATYTPTMEIFSSYCSLAKSSSEFCQFIENELEQNNFLKEEERKSFAKIHTWENSVNEMMKVINI